MKHDETWYTDKGLFHVRPRAPTKMATPECVERRFSKEQGYIHGFLWQHGKLPFRWLQCGSTQTMCSTRDCNRVQRLLVSNALSFYITRTSGEAMCNRFRFQQWNCIAKRRNSQGVLQQRAKLNVTGEPRRSGGLHCYPRRLRNLAINYRRCNGGMGRDSWRSWWKRWN